MFIRIFNTFTDIIFYSLKFFVYFQRKGTSYSDLLKTLYTAEKKIKICADVYDFYINKISMYHEQTVHFIL